jgi:uncharacterized protein
MDWTAKGNKEGFMNGKTANPAPLGLMGFGMTTILLNIHNAMPEAFPLCNMIIAMGICYGGLAQILAGIFEFKLGNTFGTTAFCSYGLFWWSLVAIWLIPAIGKVAPVPESFLAWYLFSWGLFTFFMFFGTLKSPRALQVVFFSLFVLFFLLAARDWGMKELAPIAGWEGIFCGASAFYFAMAQVINEQLGRTVLPVGAPKAQA